jgi:hypothetical protein
VDKSEMIITQRRRTVDQKTAVGAWDALYDTTP